MYTTHICICMCVCLLAPVCLYSRLYSQEKSTPLEVKEEVVRHLKEKEILEQSLPSAIVIGPFMVNVEAVRTSLSMKRRAVANAVIERLALKLRKQMEEASFTVFHYICSLFQSWRSKIMNI